MAKSERDDSDRPAEPSLTPLLLSLTDAAHLLGIGRTLVWELTRTGTLPSMRLGRRLLIPRAALEAFVEAQTTHNTSDPSSL